MCSSDLRRKRGLSLGAMLLYVVWPSVSVLVLVAAAVLATLQFNQLAAASVIVSLLIGVVVYACYRPR